jgi:hypothetical protein
MAITYPLSIPSIEATVFNIRAVSVVGSSASPFTGQTFEYKHSGQWWEAEMKFPPMPRADADALYSFLLKLNGKWGTFLMGDPAGTTPRGVATGTPLVDGASQTGDELVTDGWTPSTTGIMKAGDWIQLGSSSSSRLHKILEDVNSDGSGSSTLTIWPSLRESPSDDAAIAVNSAQGRWRLVANEAECFVDHTTLYGITLACREAL